MYILYRTIYKYIYIYECHLLDENSQGKGPKQICNKYNSDSFETYDMYSIFDLLKMGGNQRACEYWLGGGNQLVHNVSIYCFGGSLRDRGVVNREGGWGWSPNI